jgi:hypothetical protein
VRRVVTIRLRATRHVVRMTKTFPVRFLTLTLCVASQVHAALDAGARPQDGGPDPLAGETGGQVARLVLSGADSSAADESDRSC